MEILPIATVKNDFTSKFSIPRQSGLVKMTSEIIFEPRYRDVNALRGLEDFDYIWLIWGFSENIREEHALTVRPPRLGGNVRMGVFATRSPFRPNNLGLSCVKLEKIEGTRIFVSGADLMNGTPIYDIKPYIPYSDAYPNARGGFTDSTEFSTLEVKADDGIKNKLGEKWETLESILQNDPRPAYKQNEEKVYGFRFADYEIKFTVKDGVLTVTEVQDA